MAHQASRGRTTTKWDEAFSLTKTQGEGVEVWPTRALLSRLVKNGVVNIAMNFVMMNSKILLFLSP